MKCTKCGKEYTKTEGLMIPICQECELAFIAEMMEEMAGKPEERHIRQPGEKCMYELQRIENEKERNR